MEPHRSDDQAIEDAVTALLSARHAVALPPTAPDRGGLAGLYHHAVAGSPSRGRLVPSERPAVGAHHPSGLAGRGPQQQPEIREQRHWPQSMQQPLLGYHQHEFHQAQVQRLQHQQYMQQYQQQQQHTQQYHQQQRQRPLQHQNQQKKMDSQQQHRPQDLFERSRAQYPRPSDAQHPEQASHTNRPAPLGEAQQLDGQRIGDINPGELGYPEKDHRSDGQHVRRTPTVPQQVRQQAKPTQQRQRYEQREKDKKPKQPKASQKRKSKNKQRQEIDEIVARAELQPEFARQYTPILAHAVAASHEGLPRPNSSAVIRPGQSIVPRPYQRRPIDIDPRLRAIPGIHGLYVGDIAQNYRPLPTLRISESSTTSKPALKVAQDTLPARFPSVYEHSPISRAVWSQRKPDSSQGRSQTLQGGRDSGVQMPNKAPHRSLSDPEVEGRPQADAQFMALSTGPSLPEPSHQQQVGESVRQESFLLNAQVMLQQKEVEQPQPRPPKATPLTQPGFHNSVVQGFFPGQNFVGHQTSEHHYYLPSPSTLQQKPKPIPKFEDAWSDADRRSIAASNVSSSFHRAPGVDGAAFGAGAMLQSSTALLPSLEFRSKNSSDWFYPMPKGQKGALQERGKKGKKNYPTVNLSLKVAHDQQQVARCVDDSATNMAFTTTLEPRTVSNPGVVITPEAVNDPSTSFNVGGKPNKVHAHEPGKPVSKNRLRKMEKQTRRQERKVNAKIGRGKQHSESAGVQQPRQQEQNPPEQVVQDREETDSTVYLHCQSLHNPAASRSTNHSGQQQPPRVPREQGSQPPHLAQTSSSSQSMTKAPNHTGFGVREAAQKWAVQRRHEAQVRRAHLAMVAQQQLCRRNADDSTCVPRPTPTVVMNSSVGSTEIPFSKVKDVEMGDEWEAPTSTVRNEASDALSVGSSAPAPMDDPAGELHGMTKGKERKARKRKAPTSFSVPESEAASQSVTETQEDSRPTQRPRTDEHEVIDMTGAAVGVPTAITKTSPTVVPTRIQDGPLAPPLPESSRSETETVMIFCKRDFFRYQAGLLWKKYQEIKRKRDHTLANLTGRRARYLNARYTSSKVSVDGAGVEQAGRDVSQMERRLGNLTYDTSANKVPAVIEIVDDDEGSTDEAESTPTSERSDSVEDAPGQQGTVLLSPSAKAGDVMSPDTVVEVNVRQDKTSFEDSVNAATEGCDHGRKHGDILKGQLEPSSAASGDGILVEASCEAVDTTNEAAVPNDLGVVVSEECVV